MVSPDDADAVEVEEVAEAEDRPEDDDDIEVDVVEGEVRLAETGPLKAEARTIQHLLTN